MCKSGQSTRRNISLTATHTPCRSVITSCWCRRCDLERVCPPSLVTSARPRSNHRKRRPKHENEIKKRTSDVAGQVGPTISRALSWCPLADFLALQLVLTARSGAPLRLMGHFVWPTYFLDPRGPRAHISCSPIHLSSPRFPLYIYLPISA